MAVSYVYVKDKDGNATKMAAHSYDAAMYPNNVSYDPQLAAKIGMFSGEDAVEICGFNADMAVVASTEIVGDTGATGSGTNITRVTATAGVAMKVASTDNTDDVPGGAGALTIGVTGVGAGYALATATAALSGNTEQTLGTFIAINKLEVLTAGASTYNVGDIWVGSGTFTAGVPATKYFACAATKGRSRMGIYTVPNNKTLYVDRIMYRLSAAGAIKLRAIDYSTADEVYKEIQLFDSAGAVENAVQEYRYSLKFTEKTRI